MLLPLCRLSIASTLEIEEFTNLSVICLSFACISVAVFPRTGIVMSETLSHMAYTSMRFFRIRLFCSLYVSSIDELILVL